MRPAGVREVERAKADGRWDAAYDGPGARSRVPDDLQRELDARPAAAAFFAGLDSRNRYAILYRLQDAKKPETRARRLEKFVAMLEAGRDDLPAGGAARLTLGVERAQPQRAQSSGSGRGKPDSSSTGRPSADDVRAASSTSTTCAACSAPMRCGRCSASASARSTRGAPSRCRDRLARERHRRVRRAVLGALEPRVERCRSPPSRARPRRRGTRCRAACARRPRSSRSRARRRRPRARAPRRGSRAPRTGTATPSSRVRSGWSVVANAVTRRAGPNIAVRIVIG